MVEECEVKVGMVICLGGVCWVVDSLERMDQG